MEVEHRPDLERHQLLGRPLDARGVGGLTRLPLVERPAGRQIAVQRIVGGGLVGDQVGQHAAAHELRKDLGRVAEQADREGAPLHAAALDHRQRLVEVGRHPVEVAGLEPALDPARPAFDREQRGPGHGRRQRLGAAHAAETAGQDPFAREIAAIVLPAGLDEGLVGALDDPLAADVDPGARGHLAVHHQALTIEGVELVPGRPMRDQVGVGDQHARRVGMGPEHADRLARLDAEGLVVAQRLERLDQHVVAAPVARRPADAAVDHQLFRALGDLGIEVVHQHPQRRLGLPAPGVELGAARRPDLALVVASVQVHGQLSKPAAAIEPTPTGPQQPAHVERLRWPEKTLPAATGIWQGSPAKGCSCQAGETACGGGRGS